MFQRLFYNKKIEGITKKKMVEERQEEYELFNFYSPEKNIIFSLTNINVIDITISNGDTFFEIEI